MKQLRKLLLVMFTSILVMASSSATANQNNSNDLDLIFGTSATQSIELASLSDAEMVATEGELIPILALYYAVAIHVIAYSPIYVAAAYQAANYIRRNY